MRDDYAKGCGHTPHKKQTGWGRECTRYRFFDKPRKEVTRHTFLSFLSVALKGILCRTAFFLPASSCICPL